MTTNTTAAGGDSIIRRLAAPLIPSAISPSRAATPMTAPIPTTPHRTVRFDLDETGDMPEWQEADTPNQPSFNDSDVPERWVDRPEAFEIYSDEDEEEGHGHGGSGREDTRAPLLTGTEAPAVVLAETIDGEEERPKSGMGMAFFNMSNSIIGAGIIGQPYAFRQAGLIMGVLLLFSLTIVVNWTINLIVINSKLSGANSFQSTVSACFGKRGLIAISVAQWAFAFGGMIAFCIIIGDSIPHVMIGAFPTLDQIPVLGLLTNRRAVIVICTMGVSYPLSLYRDIAKLAKASAFALLSMGVIVFTVLTQGAYVPAESRGDMSLPLWTINGGVFQAIGVISFAFVCHHNSLLIYGSLRKPTLDRFATVTNYSTGISFVACLGVALGGFLTFKDKTEGNVLNNFPSDNILVNISRLCFGLNMLTTLPLEAFVCREVVETYFFPHEPFNRTRHILLTTVHVGAAMLFSLMTCDLGAVFELIGATSACALAYILPPMCYLKLATRTWKTYPAMATVVFGFVVMSISVMQALYGIVFGAEGTKKECN